MPKKRSDGRYSKQITVGHKNGKPIRKTVYGKTQKELDKNFRDLMLLVDQGIALNDMGMTVTELRKTWYRVKKEGKLKRNSELTYTSIMKRIDKAIGDIKVKDITKYTIEEFLVEIQSKGQGCTATLVLFILYSMFDYAVDNSIISRNPCKGLSVKYERKEKRILTQEELSKIDNADNLHPLEYTFLLLLRYTGMRRGEIFALTKSDIDEKNMVIHISKSVIDNNGKPFIQDSVKTIAGRRIVPIFEPLKKKLFDYINELETDLLFPDKNGNVFSVTNMKRLYSSIVNNVDLGTDLTMHCFRHNFISECYMAGIDIKKLQKWVGHTDISTTLNIYTKLAKEVIENPDDMNKYYNSQDTVTSETQSLIIPVNTEKNSNQEITTL